MTEPKKRGGYRHGKRGGVAIKVVVPPEIAEAYRATGRPLSECAYEDLLRGRAMLLPK